MFIEVQYREYLTSICVVRDEQNWTGHEVQSEVFLRCCIIYYIVTRASQYGRSPTTHHATVPLRTLPLPPLPFPAFFHIRCCDCGCHMNPSCWTLTRWFSLSPSFIHVTWHNSPTLLPFTHWSSPDRHAVKMNSSHSFSGDRSHFDILWKYEFSIRHRYTVYIYVFFLSFSLFFSRILSFQRLDVGSCQSPERRDKADAQSLWQPLDGRLCLAHISLR